MLLYIHLNTSEEIMAFYTVFITIFSNNDVIQLYAFLLAVNNSVTRFVRQLYK